MNRGTDLARTAAALIDYAVRGVEPDLDTLLKRHEDPQFAADLMIGLAGIGGKLGHQLGEPTAVVAFLAMGSTATVLTGDRLRADPELWTSLVEGITTTVEYIAGVGVIAFGPEGAAEKTRELVNKLAVRA